MKKDNAKNEKRTLRGTLVRVATAGVTLCTTLMVLSPFFEGGTGPKIPPAQGE